MAGMAYDLDTPTEVMWSIPRLAPKDKDPRFTSHLPPNPGEWAKVTAYQRGHDIQKWRKKQDVFVKKKNKQIAFDASSAKATDSSSTVSEKILNKANVSFRSDSLTPTNQSSDDLDAELSVLSSSESEEEEDTMLKKYTPYQREYKFLVDTLGVASLNAVHRQIDTYHIDLRQAKMSHGEFKAIATCLCSKSMISRLDLTECMLDAVKIGYLCELLWEGISITDLILAGNQMGSVYTKRILNVITNLDYINYLDISGNGLKDDIAKHIANYIETSSALNYLLMKKNNFGESVGRLIGHAIGSNTSLVYLDLSWNKIRRRGAVDLLHGCANSSLETLDLSWNGLREEGSWGLKRLLSNTSTLKSLNISGTGMNSKCLDQIVDGLEANSTLERLYIMHNPLMLEDFTVLLQSVHKMPNSALNKIDLGEHTIQESAVPIIDLLFKENKIDVSYGSTIGYSDSKTQGEGLFTRFNEDGLQRVTRLTPENRLILVRYFAEKDLKANVQVKSSVGRAVGRRRKFLQPDMTYRDLAQRLKMEGDVQATIDSILSKFQGGSLTKEQLDLRKHKFDIATVRDRELRYQFGEDDSESEDLSAKSKFKVKFREHESLFETPIQSPIQSPLQSPIQTPSGSEDSSLIS